MTTQQPAANILVVEDEPSIRDVVVTALTHRGHTVQQSDNGRNALEMALQTQFDLLVLDVMLPGLDGFEICRRLRAADQFTPVLFLTARDETASRIKGFTSGGDDYLTKPFSIDELTLRVQAILRRTATPIPDDELRVDDLVMRTEANEVRRDGQLIELSPTEFRLLQYLMMNADVVLSKSRILTNVWDYDYEGSENVVELYIGYLRRKIDDGRPPLIHTRRGVGYVLRKELA